VIGTVIVTVGSTVTVSINIGSITATDTGSDLGGMIGTVIVTVESTITVSIDISSITATDTGSSLGGI